jgi:hypothetical protein
VIQLVVDLTVVVLVVPTLPLTDFITVMTRLTYVREYDDQRAEFRSEEPVSHQWATTDHESSQV